MATEILRPNAAGAETSIGYQYPTSGYHWDKVDEDPPDDADSTVFTNAFDYERDLYQIEDSSIGTGTINHVRVYARCAYMFVTDRPSLKIVLKSGGVVSEGEEIYIYGNGVGYHDFSETWDINPGDGQAWEWSDINALQVGIALRDPTGGGEQITVCTQVYVVVDYTPTMEGIISSFAITGYHDPAAPPTVAGSIVGLLYWYEGLPSWQQLPETPPTVPINTAFHLAAQWLNQSAEPIAGHIELIITKPDGTKVTLNDVLNQDNWAAPSNGWRVQFEPVNLDQVGTYKAAARLTTMGQVLDEKTMSIANVFGIARFYMPAAMRKKLTDGTILNMYWNCEVWVDITNNGDAPGTQIVHIWDSVGNVNIYITVTLQPGETYTWYRAQWIDFRRISAYTVEAQGDWEGNNYSVARFP